MNRSVLAVDIGATKATIGVITDQLELVDKSIIPTGTNDEIWSEIQKAVGDLINRNKIKIDGIGIGAAGPIDVQSGIISPVNIPSWKIGRAHV